MSRALTLASATIAGLLVSGAAAAVVPPAPEVSLGTAAGSSPQIGPGQYRATVPGDQVKRYVRIQRAAGEGVTVAAYGVPAPGADWNNETLTLGLALPDGTSCGSNSASPSGSDAGAPIGTHAVLDGTETARMDAEGVSEPRCATATDLLVEVSRDAQGQPSMSVELTYVREPKAGNAADRRATAADLTATQVSPKDDSAKSAGSSPQTATPLGPDEGATLQVTPGKPAYYKVHLGWDQRVGVAAQVPRNGAAYELTHDLDVAVTILGPNGAPVRAGGEYSASLYTSPGSPPEPRTVTAFTAPVRWNNRDVGSSLDGATGLSTKDVAFTTQPGWYVVGLFVGASGSSSATPAPNLTPVPASVTVKVIGQEKAGPTFTAAGGTPLAAPPAGELSGAGEEEGSSGLLLRLGGSALVVLLAAGAVVWALRARRHTVAGPGED